MQTESTQIINSNNDTSNNSTLYPNHIQDKEILNDEFRNVICTILFNDKEKDNSIHLKKFILY